MRFSVTSTVASAVAAPVKFSRAAPETRPDSGSPAAATRLMDRSAEPVPDDGVT